MTALVDTHLPCPVQTAYTVLVSAALDWTHALVADLQVGDDHPRDGRLGAVLAAVRAVAPAGNSLHHRIQHLLALLVSGVRFGDDRLMSTGVRGMAILVDDRCGNDTPAALVASASRHGPAGDQLVVLASLVEAGALLDAGGLTSVRPAAIPARSGASPHRTAP